MAPFSFLFVLYTESYIFIKKRPFSTSLDPGQVPWSFKVSVSGFILFALFNFYSFINVLID